MSATIAQVQGVLDQVIHAVELLFGFALVAGLVVLVATVSATREARAREFAVMRAVGASGTLLGRVQRVELLGVGALAGLLAASAARRGGLGPGHLGVRVPLEPAVVGAARRRGQRRRAGAGGRLVEPARGAGAAGDGDPAARRAGVTMRTIVPSRERRAPAAARRLIP